MDWIGLDWTGLLRLDRTILAGLDWIGLDLMRLDLA